MKFQNKMSILDNLSIQLKIEIQEFNLLYIPNKQKKRNMDNEYDNQEDIYIIQYN